MTHETLSSFFPAAEWLNPPPNWSVDVDNVLHARSGTKTDFWQRTYYGFIRDDGHALLAKRSGEFTATLTFTGRYETLYDQAGLMIRNGPDQWVKFGVEFSDGIPNLSCVVTDGVSDWSARPSQEALKGPMTIRATRIGNALLLQSRVNSSHGSWQMERLAPFSPTSMDVTIGPYLCSPERSGFEAQFIDLKLTDPKVRKLHD